MLICFVSITMTTESSYVLVQPECLSMQSYLKKSIWVVPHHCFTVTNNKNVHRKRIVLLFRPPYGISS